MDMDVVNEAGEVIGKLESFSDNGMHSFPKLLYLFYAECDIGRFRPLRG